MVFSMYFIYVLSSGNRAWCSNNVNIFPARYILFRFYKSGSYGKKTSEREYLRRQRREGG